MSFRSVEQFAEYYQASSNILNWMTEKCGSMEVAWDKAPPGILLWIATRPGVMTSMDLRIMAHRYVRNASYRVFKVRFTSELYTVARHIASQFPVTLLEAQLHALFKMYCCEDTWQRSLNSKAVWCAMMRMAVAQDECIAAEAMWLEFVLRNAVNDPDNSEEEAARWKDILEGQVRWIRDNVKPNFDHGVTRQMRARAEARMHERSRSIPIVVPRISDVSVTAEEQTRQLQEEAARRNRSANARSNFWFIVACVVWLVLSTWFTAYLLPQWMAK